MTHSYRLLALAVTAASGERPLPRSLFLFEIFDFGSLKTQEDSTRFALDGIGQYTRMARYASTLLLPEGRPRLTGAIGVNAGAYPPFSWICSRYPYFRGSRPAAREDELSVSYFNPSANQLHTGFEAILLSKRPEYRI
ncbi:hypothetical protein C8R46DRAFT_472197 [Mycena filopes]|nr:hypothetical protein C8R46DRAFT_472197 [Mycena filopes]